VNPPRTCSGHDDRRDLVRASNLLSDIKPGYMLGAKPRQQAIGHVIGIFAGTLTTVPLFFLLFLTPNAEGVRSTSTIVSEQFAMPAAVQWKGVADLITNGLSQLPPSAVISMIVAAVLALVFEILRIRTRGGFPLSAVSIGLGVILPPESCIAMWVGAMIFWWQGRKKPAPGTRAHAIWVDGYEAICAGLISGAALVGIGNAIVNVLIDESTGAQSCWRHGEYRLAQGRSTVPMPCDRCSPPRSGTTLASVSLVAPAVREVFRARESFPQRDVAIKVLDPSLALTADLEEQFLREARIIAGTEHPHIVPLYAAESRQGLLYLVMRLLPGQALSDRIKEGKLAPPDAARLALETARALAAAHANGVVHRDIKPDNILLDASGRTVTDFGISRVTATAAKWRVTVGTPT
jgi:hypothetical protein